jgi:hypothetical protein
MSPKITLTVKDPMQYRYEDGTGAYWGVARLVNLVKPLEPFDAPLAALDLSAVIWQGANILSLAEHCKKVADADLSYPVILDWNGEIADGRHRVIKALTEGRITVKVVRLMERPAPCGYID